MALNPALRAMVAATSAKHDADALADLNLITVARCVQMADDFRKPNAVLLDVMTPLEKPLRDCTGEEVQRLAELCREAGKFLDQINQ